MKWSTLRGAGLVVILHSLDNFIPNVPRPFGNGMRRLAEAGGTAHELMAISGHKTLSEVQHYTEEVNRKRLADTAIAKLRGQSENASVANLNPRSGKLGLIH